jgi:hypothetical protein
MEAVATFTLDPVAPLSLNHLGFFSHGSNRYQMVPFRGTRMMDVSVVGSVRIATSNRDVVRIGPLSSDTPWQSSYREFASNEKTEHSFLLHGIGVGRAVVIVEDLITGKRLDTLVVSVKQNISKSYQLLMLQDIHRMTKRGGDQLIAIMKGVSTLFANQANVTLRQERSPNQLYISEDLGDPIDLQHRSVALGQWLTELSAESLEVVGSGRQDFTIVSSWNLADGLDETVAGIDPAFGKIMFCEDQKEDTLLVNASLFAHELAHAFKCHHRTDPPNLLMQLNIGSCQMSDVEIDTINPTGLK